jgi:triacylglycerol esterase/lipase EstA (alpha/beta hydrolase family)
MWLAVFAACTAEPPATDAPTAVDAGAHSGAPSTPGPACPDGEAVVEGEAALQGRPLTRVDQAGCTAGLHATAGAKDSVLQVRVDADRDVIVSAVDPAGRALLEDTVVAAGDLSPTRLVPLAVAGEALLTVRAAEPTDEPWSYTLGAECAEGCDRPFTRYPILLMHGLSGADTIFGVDYFYRVTETLHEAGVVVASPGVAAFSDSVARATEWSSAVDDLLAQGHRRVNLLGHSQGGLDARTLASPAGRNRGDVVASVTTIGTPHRGTPLADTILALVEGGLVDETVADAIIGVYSSILGLQSDDPEVVAALVQLAESTMAQQDVALVDHPATWYGSWLGHSCGILEPACLSRMDGEVVDPLMSATYLLIWPRQSDGLVPVDSQSHGVVLGELPADHADEIGQIADESANPFDHLAFYLAEVDRLEALGF